MKIIVTGQPVPKGRPRLSNGHTYTPPKTRQYEKRIKQAWKEQSGEHLNGPLKLILTAYFSIPASKSQTIKEKMAVGEILPTKRPDLDNIIKVIDALNGLAFDDDCQIVEVTARKLYSHEPRLEIEIGVANT